jgi:hypothetical protein
MTPTPQCGSPPTREAAGAGAGVGSADGDGAPPKSHLRPNVSHNPSALPGGVEAERGICGRSVVFALSPSPSIGYAGARAHVPHVHAYLSPSPSPARSRKSCENIPRRTGREIPVAGGVDAERGVCARSKPD